MLILQEAFANPGEPEPDPHEFLGGVLGAVMEASNLSVALERYTAHVLGESGGEAALQEGVVEFIAGTVRIIGSIVARAIEYVGKILAWLVRKITAADVQVERPGGKPAKSEMVSVPSALLNGRGLREASAATIGAIERITAGAARGEAALGPIIEKAQAETGKAKMDKLLLSGPESSVDIYSAEVRTALDRTIDEARKFQTDIVKVLNGAKSHLEQQAKSAGSDRGLASAAHKAAVAVATIAGSGSARMAHTGMKAMVLLARHRW